MTVRLSRTARNGGGGMIRVETAPRSVQTVTRQYIAMRSPTSTPLDLVQMLPSLNISTADTSGMQGGSIAVRGLTDADMGLLLNGAPSTNVLYLNEETDPENIETVTVTPGSSAIDLPTTSAAAGVMNVTMRTPSKKRGGMVDFSYGTNNLSREFLRLETGELGRSGVRSYFSFSHAHARSWMGAGLNDRKHIDFALQKDWRNGSTLKFFTSWNNELLTIDNYPTEEQFFRNKRTGIGWGHTSRNIPGQAPSNYWGANLNSWNQLFVTAPLHLVLNDRLTFELNPYLSYGQGWTANGATSGSLSSGGDGAVYDQAGAPIPAGQQLIPYYQQTQSRVAGAVARLNYQLDRHNRLSLGYWYENNISQYQLPVSVALEDGRAPNPSLGSHQTYIRQNGRLVRNTSAIDAGYELHGLFLQNTSRYLHNHLTVTAGLKFIMSNLWDKTASPAARAALGENATAPLPQLSIGYQIDRHSQIYVNAEGDFRQPTPANLVAVGSQLPRNQYSIKEELGYRYNNRFFMIDASFFNYNITSRLMSTYLGGATYGTINAGNQTSRGFDFLIAGHPFHHVSPYASVEYLHSSLDTDVAYGASYLPTRGIQAPLAPHVMANFGLSYDDRHFFGNFGMHYAGPQSVTLVGDQRIPGYITDNLSIGYHFKSFLYAKSPTFKLNFTNLTGSSVRSGANGIATNRHAVTLVNGTAGPAANNGALFYVVPRFTMTGSFSTSF